MSNNAVKTVAAALKKSVAGDSAGTLKLAAATDSELTGGKSVDKTNSPDTAIEGPFSFDYSKLEDLRKAYNSNDAYALSKLLPDKTTFVYRREIPDEELQQSAQDYVDEKFGYDIEQKNVSADRSVHYLEQQLASAEKDASEKSQKAVDAYFAGVENVADKTVRQGIVRSSVYEGLMQDLSDTLVAEQTKIESELNAKTESIRTQIEYVEAERTSALKEYDFYKAEAYEKKLRSLRNAEYAARKEIVAYNKQISAWKSDINKVRRQYAEQILVDAAKRGLFN